MQKIFFPLILGASIAVFAMWAFDRPAQAALIMPPKASKISHPKDYFASPIASAIRLTGTCGELRPEHFHAGLDIDGRVGDAVFAAAEGYIETIKVLPNGYGNILFMRHPNGYATAYAHLDRFESNIQQYVQQNQYEHERFEVELKPPPGLFTFKKGQQIAYLGNTGSSSGPHLHFEIRSPEGKAINPLLCGIPVNDDVAPDIRDLKVYVLNDRREVLASQPFSLQKDKQGNIGLDGDTVRIIGLRVGFGVKTYDHSTGLRNDNGVYSVALYADDQLAFEWTANEFDFDDTRYLNAHIDYAAKQRYGAWFHRCFTLPGDFLTNYTRTPSMGAILLDADKPTKITLKVGDAFGNIRTLQFWALRDVSTLETFLTAPYQFLMPFDAENHIDMDGFSMLLPKGALYESLHLQYMVEDDSSRDEYSPMHHLHDAQTPLHTSFELKIKPTRLPDRLRSKAVIANCNDGRPDNCGATWQGDWLSTRVRSFGDFCIMADTIPPRITPVIFSADMRKKSAIAFRITDNFAITGTADAFTYRGTIDGHWVLFKYDKKRSRITYDFDEHVGKGTHTIRITAKDDRGNEGVFEGKFTK